MLKGAANMAVHYYLEILFDLEYMTAVNGKLNLIANFEITQEAMSAI